MGLGWTTLFGGSVRLDFPKLASEGTKNKVHFWGPSGYRVVFDRKGTSNEFDRPEPGLNGDLERKSDGSYVLKWFDQSKYEFDANGQLQRTIDKNGSNRLEFAYTGQNNKLSMVTDTRGRTMRMTYTNGLVTEVGLHADAKVNTPSKMAWRYVYEAGSSGRAVLRYSYLHKYDRALVGGADAGASGEDPNVGKVTEYRYLEGSERLALIIDPLDVHDPNNSPGGTTHIEYAGSTERVATFTRIRGQYDQGAQSDAATMPDSTLTFTYDTAPTASGNNAPCRTQDLDDNPSATATIVDGERTDLSDTARYCVDKHGRVLRSTDARGKQRKKTWTANSNVAEADMPGLGTGIDQYTFDYVNDNPEQSKSPEGAVTNADYADTLNSHSPTSVSDDTSSDDGNPDNGDDSEVSWAYEYDDKNNLRSASSRTGADSPDVQYNYCWTSRGQIKRVDPPVAERSQARNMSTSPQRNADLGDDARCFGSDGNGNPNPTPAQGNDTLFTYNGIHELIGVDRPAGGDRTFSHDKLSRIKTVTDGRGVTTTYTYDARDRVTKAAFTKTGSTTQTVTWTYDANGNRLLMSDANGDNAFAYDELNRMTLDTVKNTSGVTVYETTYAYDSASNLRQTKVASEARPTTYSYDNLNRVQWIDDQRPGTVPPADEHDEDSFKDAAVISFEYNNKDSRRKTRFPNLSGGPALIEERRYTKDGNIRCIYSYRRGSGADESIDDESCPGADAVKLITFRGYDYTKDMGAAPDKQTSTIHKITETGGRTTRFEYDAIKRLELSTTRADDSTSSTLHRRFEYDYDRHSNLAHQQITQGPTSTPGLTSGDWWHAYNAGDEICRSAQQSTNPNLACSSSTTGRTAYTHDGDGDMQSATGTGAMPGTTTPISMAYDGVMQDRRTQRGSTTMNYGFAGQTAQATPAQGSVPSSSQTFVRDPGGELLALIPDLNANAARYYMTDHQKSIIGTYDTAQAASGQVTRYLYEPYGRKIRTWTDANAGNYTSGSVNDGASGSTGAVSSDVNPWGYASGYHEAGSSLIKFGTRYLSPEIARWTQQDPENGDVANPLTLQRHQYVEQNPINSTDSTGRYTDDYYEPYCAPSVGCVDGEGVEGYPYPLPADDGGCALGLTFFLTAPLTGPIGTIPSVVYGGFQAVVGCF